MANIDINITTKYADAVKGANQVADSYKKLGSQMVKTSQEGGNLDEVMSKYSDALSKALINEEQTKDGMAALTAQAKILKSEMAKIGLSIGEDNDLYRKMSSALDEVNKEMAILPANTRKASSSMDQMGKSSGNAATKLLSVAKNILKFQLLMGPITAAVRGFRNTISDSLKMAAEAEQRFNKLATVFDGLAESATNAARAIASELGVATSTAASALSTVGDLLQAQGMGTADSLSLSSDWVKQFQDIIAFKDINMSLEEFAQTFMSGAAGNLRNFRTFGSIVKESAVQARLASQGLDTLTGSELELAKMTTRATMALEQQANAMGATEREWDTMLSINRRLNEAWKEYKENLGDSLNRFLKPAKSWLANILDYTNDVTRALKEIEGGEFTIKVKQESGDELTKRILGVMKQLTPEGAINQKMTTAQEAKMYNALGFSQMAPVSKANPVAQDLETATRQWSAKQLAEVMLSLGATRADMEEAFKGVYEVADSIWVEAESLEKQYRDEKTAIEKMKAAMLSSAESADTFIESLATLSHISYQWSDLANIPKSMAFNSETLKNGSGDFNTIIGHGVSDAVSEVYKQLSRLGPDAFANPLQLAFGLNNPEEDYQAWMDEIMSFYSLLSNRQKQFGDVSDYELERVIALWGQVNGMLEDYRAELARPEILAQQTANQINASSLMRSFRNGIPSMQATGKYATADTWRSAQKESLRNTEAQLLALGMAASDVNAWIAQMIPLINEEYEAKKAAIDEEERQTELQKQKDAYDQIMKGANPFSGLVDTYNMGETAGIGGIYAILLSIATQTEAFSKISSLVSDHIVPILDAFLEPILPLIDVIGGTMQAILQAILVSLFPIIVEISAALTEIIGTIKNMINLVVDVIKASIGSFAYGVLKALDKIIIGDQSGWYEGTWMEKWAAIDPWSNFLKAQDELNAEVKKIRGLTFDIKENTDKDDLKTLRELYSRGIINEDQFYAGARVMQKSMVFDPVSPSSSNYATYGNVTIYVNGGDPAELKRTLQEFFNENGMSYNMAYGRA